MGLGFSTYPQPPLPPAGPPPPPKYLIFLDRPAQIPITLAQLNAGKKLATQNFNAKLH